jgi:hypothetical protein
MNDVQIKNSFDKVTIERIMRSFFHTVITAALFGAASMAITAASGFDTGNPAVNSILVFTCSQLYNTLKEYKTGQAPTAPVAPDNQAN